ncbi:E3 ubiquitin-protein ligase RING1-like [Phragmites australis]|uniref:E3 ubiquitin-protein ligase RING1-like n=1 Tax=Phragmites australis TaxID=29695 RepID=UPI002D7751B9|nr:E3 ubiquitin-protein ligase RING1-like [Phragmites australis]
MSSSSFPPSLLRYYCHQCDRDVSIAPPASPDADILCPRCAGGFVEELPPPPHHPFLFDLRHPSDLSAFFGPPSPASPNFDTSNFLHDHFGGLLSGGATIQIVLEGAPTLAPGLSLGDYFMGAGGGLEQLIQQLAENDPNRYGTPPAAKSAVAALPDVAVSADMMQADGGAQCAVCMDDFHLGAAAKQLPCNHVFHKDCILPWLDLHSSCPVCRFELPTDDPDHQHQRASAPAASSPRVAERRFRISLPWSLRAAFGGATTQAETSNLNTQAQEGRRDDDAPSGGNSSSSNASGGPHRGYDDLD